MTDDYTSEELLARAILGNIIFFELSGKFELLILRSGTQTEARSAARQPVGVGQNGKVPSGG